MSLLAILFAVPLCIPITGTVVGVYGNLILTRSKSYEVLVEVDGNTVIAHGILFITVHGTGGPTFDNTCSLVALGGIEVVVYDERSYINRFIVVATHIRNLKFHYRKVTLFNLSNGCSIVVGTSFVGC